MARIKSQGGEEEERGEEKFNWKEAKEGNENCYKPLASVFWAVFLKTCVLFLAL